MDFLIPVLVIAFVVLVFVVSLRYEQNMRKKVDKYYAEIAEKFGLTYTPGQKGSFFRYTYAICAGIIDDFQVLLYSYKTGGKNQVTYTVLQLSGQEGIPDFKIVKKGLFQKIAKTFGGQDIPTGNRELDEKYRFICTDEQRLVQAIDGDMQDLLLHIHAKLLAPIEMKNGILNYTFVNHINTDQRRDDFEKVLVLIVKFMKAMRK